MDVADEYELYAIRYAQRAGRRQDHFMGGDPHDGPHPMDYFIWLARNSSRTVVIDCGFNRETATRRGRELLRTPSEGLSLLGVDSNTVPDLILTHLHYDHGGTLADFPGALIHMQDSEIAFASGRHMCHGYFRQAYEVEDVVKLVRLTYQERVKFYDGGSHDIKPGISVHHIGGHTPGLQCVRVKTRRGWVVLASDASHYYENFNSNRCFSHAFNIGQMLEGYRALRELSDSDDHIIPGHDPLVMEYYPEAAPDLKGIAVRLDLPPVMQNAAIR